MLLYNQTDKKEVEKMEFYMKRKPKSETGFWRECKATTLPAAKREATRTYGGEHPDAVLIIASWDGVRGQQCEIAKKMNVPHAKWVRVSKGLYNIMFMAIQ